MLHDNAKCTCLLLLDEHTLIITCQWKSVKECMICFPYFALANMNIYEGLSKSFWYGCLEWELQMVQLSATRCSCINILWVSLMSFAAITFCVASQWVFVVICLFHYWLSPETFGYTLVHLHWLGFKISTTCCYLWSFSESNLRLHILWIIQLLNRKWSAPSVLACSHNGEIEACEYYYRKKFVEFLPFWNCLVMDLVIMN
jgi:hypothetical protein